MTKPLALLFALLVSPLSATIGQSNAWGTAGDDSLSAMMLEDFPRALLSLQLIRTNERENGLTNEIEKFALSILRTFTVK